jgi:hypothetical protein
MDTDGAKELMELPEQNIGDPHQQALFLSVMR